jgi:hypothetical protein
MKHKKAVRNVTFGLATGLVPLAGAGVSAAAAGESPPSALCQSWFGERGPVGGPIVGEGPPGDTMTVTVGWETGTWPDGLREVVNCVGIDGHLVADLTRSTLTPRNTGNLIVDLLLPHGAPGSLVCQQSVLLGKGKAEGREHSTAPVCFKLRAAEELAAGPGSADEQTPPASKAPIRVPATPPSHPPASVPAARPAVGQNTAPAPTSNSSTPPARAAFEAARGAARSPAAWAAPTRSAQAFAPSAPLTRAAPAATELARTPPVNDRATKTPQAAGTAQASTARGASAASAPGAPDSGAITARAALPHTGLGDKIPLAGAGSLMALGGAAIILGEPRRRRAPRPA